jgi:hypothetical protein
MNSKIDISKLKKIQQDKANLKYKAFNQILKMCHNKINAIGMSAINYCWFLIPNLLWGYSVYDIEECGEYIEEKLKENGFNVEYYKPNILYISW